MKIETITVASGGTSSIVFNNIPQTYNDLKIVASGRGTRNFETDDLVIRFNGSSTNYSGRRLYSGGGAPGSSATSDTLTDIRGFVPGSPTTADIFGNNEFYIANYTSSNDKSVQVHAVGENNGLVSYLGFTAGLWNNGSAITSITMFANNGNLTEFSTFTLYGITRVPAGAKATGGVIYDDSNYWYHTFTSSGIFAPSQTLSCDVLVIAGGGSGSWEYGGGGGAGGLCYQAGRSITSGNKAITIGAGGAFPSVRGVGNAGSDSVFETITANGGGRGDGWTAMAGGGAGGSGGGGSIGAVTGLGTLGGSSNQSASGGATGYGNAGGAGWRNPATNYSGGGGGGAGGAGANAGQNVTGGGGNGGVGLSGLTIPALNEMGAATGTGQLSDGNYYYAGGGGGYYRDGITTTYGIGGLGGGGGAVQYVPYVLNNNGLANTGGGGGGDDNNNGRGSGGSGIVIIRYAK